MNKRTRLRVAMRGRHAIGAVIAIFPGLAPACAAALVAAVAASHGAVA
jgi:hypothetical protein